MAQDFERTLTANIDTSLADIRATSNSDDAIVGIRMANTHPQTCLLYTSPSPRDGLLSRMPSSA